MYMWKGREYGRVFIDFGCCKTGKSGEPCTSLLGEELHLPIKRNELGHRYYTKEDVERFKEIKSMKERGLQLKAFKMILKDGRLDVLPEEREKEPVEDKELRP